jgi:peptidoglycan/xylan/chitin deacetylase (PgdA/CDA1 family)
MKPRKPLTPAAIKKHLVISLTFAFILFIAGFVGFFLGWKQVKAPVLLALNFHGVVESPSAPWEITQPELESILATLKNYDFKPVSPQNFSGLYQQEPRKGRHVLVTFDDGLQSSAAAIKKLYLEKGISAAFFIVTDLVGKEGYADFKTLRDLQKNYNCQIGLHGKRHYEVTKILAQGNDLYAELQQARDILENNLKTPVSWYAYPYGEYNATASQIIAASNYEFAFTVDGHEIDQHAKAELLPRIMYLQGAVASGAPDPLDYAPPQIAKTGSLTITLACLVMFLSFSWLLKARNFFYLLKKLRSQKKQSSL